MNATILIACDPAGWGGFLSSQVAHLHELATERLDAGEFREVSDWFAHAGALLDEAGERIAAGRGHQAATVALLEGVVEVLGRIALGLVSIGPGGGGS
ncbi:MAG: hypothetical protein E6Q92_02520 [Burkholderiaceae bacterium]|nr:MAG: hypothetical protein E6Q92_02520 [Burkholderiaceae bacterium]